MIGESGHNRTDMVSLYAYEAVQHMGTNILGLAAREGWGGMPMDHGSCNQLVP